jgi:hypothetical protein
VSILDEVTRWGFVFLGVSLFAYLALAVWVDSKERGAK